jgi:RsmE family RNA methyltransferase
LNFLLLRPDEIDAAGLATLRGRRAEHVRTVLRAEVGQELKAGVLGGQLGTATVRSVGADRLDVATSLHDEPAPTPDVLLLAVPRPKVLMRMLAHAAALGFGRILLFRSWRVEKSHLQSTAMRPEVQREQLLLGLEQAGRTRLPTVQFFPLFKPMVEDHLRDLPDACFVAHPAAPTNTNELALGPGSAFALALGPDGGFLPYEVARLAERGFLPISCGAHPQRTETALAVLWGQLALLRARGSLRQ